MLDARLSSRLATLCLMILVASASAQEASDEPPRIALCNPLGVRAGESTKLTIRGWKLDQATEVKCDLEAATIKVLGKGNAPVPGGQDTKSIGDTQIEIEITIPAETTSAEAELTVMVGEHASVPHALLIGGPTLVAEQEPNNGFSEAQSIEIPQIVEGSLHADRNVEVFQFEAEAGQSINVEIVARGRGSALDAILTMYDAKLRILQTVDDVQHESAGNSIDPKLTFKCQTTGRYFIVIQDALDRGGPAHPWRLIVQASE